ncbi:chemotaxis-specific protein-glutamate methyltransferase CheB [Acanthopleuribacter pedis]|uniref:Protein-glutamate methylesterase/protein-glutamine glutaminase n=1 Tax=Acanthopleuribacter pedis TaxID=442870 RepID=A0A8J7QFM0_9BACT|nr:chemotaxis-specific protein-glutamate methyltransferase CheB [Acanthopleuribacter pedis]MBO1317693.1 chemotaxis-specific protein-glutamate methyltransferase CheB [Acanthopleuribacter pedis]
MREIGVLIVDDSVIYRKFLYDIFTENLGLEKVDRVSGGQAALDRLALGKHKLVTLDLEMPGLSGMETLSEIRRRYPDVKVLMISSHTQSGAAVTIDALEQGAFEFVAKPNLDDREAMLRFLREEISRKVNHLLSGGPAPAVFRSTRAKVAKPIPAPKPTPMPRVHEKRAQPSGNEIALVAIGISTGGPAALATFLQAFPKDYSRPILIVQHMPAMFTKALADSLNQKSLLNVIEAQHGLPIEAGTVYIAPGGKQMCVVKKGEVPKICITDDPPESFCKPSVDYLFRSIAGAYEGKVLALIMTGMGSDGARGAQLLKRRGAVIWAESEESCVVFGMPREVIKLGLADEVLGLASLAKRCAAFFS